MSGLPLSATQLHLKKGIPFQSDYKHTRWFTSRSQQTTWFSNRTNVASFSNMTFQRDKDITFVNIPLHIDELREVNYLMFQNTHYGNKWFYCFVTKLEYANVRLTRVHFKLDVVQTWMFDMDFKPSFVVREHRPLWNSDGSPVINTIDEGLNYGTDYETVSITNHKPFGDVFFLVIVCKSAVHTGAGVTQNNAINPSMNGTPQPLTYYVQPFRIAQGGSIVQPNIQVSSRPVNSPDILETLRLIFSMDNMVNNVASLYITDYIGDDSVTYDSSSDTVTFSPSTNYSVATINDGEEEIETVAVRNIESYDTMTMNLGSKYSGVPSVTESKLLMYPYTVFVLDDFKGNRIELKPEYINGNNILLKVKGSMGTFNKTTYHVDNYLTRGINESNRNIVGIENAIINNNPNDLPIVNDFLSAFLQGNRNSILTQLKSISTNSIHNALGNLVGLGSGLAYRNPTASLNSTVAFSQTAHNYQLDIEAVNSKLSDIANVPANLSSMGGNTQFEYGNNYHGVYLIKKQITPEYKKRLTDYFNMFGYKTNEVKIPNFRTRMYWNYVQTKGCTILGDFNNEDINELKNVFDNGITLWHTDDIGNYSLNNEVR